MTEILNKEFSRKSFVKAGGAMIVGFSLLGAAAGAKTAKSAGTDPYASAGPFDAQAIDSWLTIHADNTVTLRPQVVELGQGSLTGILMIAAEELDVSLSQMRDSVNNDTNVTPVQFYTAGSSAIQSGGLAVRGAAAAAKSALLDLAATNLGVAKSSLTVSKGVVVGRRQVRHLRRAARRQAVQRPQRRRVQRRRGCARDEGRRRLQARRQARHRSASTSRPRSPASSRTRTTCACRGWSTAASSAPAARAPTAPAPRRRCSRSTRARSRTSPAPRSCATATSSASSPTRSTRRSRLRRSSRSSGPTCPTIAAVGNVFKQMRDRRLRRQGSGAHRGQLRELRHARTRPRPSSCPQSYKYHYQGSMPIGPCCAIADVSAERRPHLHELAEHLPDAGEREDGARHGDGREDAPAQQDPPHLLRGREHVRPRGGVGRRGAGRGDHVRASSASRCGSS